MKKIYLFFCGSLLFAGCAEFDVNNNARMEFTGNVTDQAGNPIPGTYVYLQGVDDIGSFSFMVPSNEQSENLGENYTDNSGNFRVVSLKTSTNIFHVNRPENSNFGYNEDTHEVHSELTNSVFTSVDFVNVSGSQDFGTIKLHKKVELHFKIKKTSTSNTTISWRLSYPHRKCYFVFENGSLLEEESSCYKIFADDDLQQQNPTFPNFEKTYQTILGGTAEFIYQINNQPEQTILLNIDETQETYVFEY